jgi:hypothetical protein
MVTIPSFRIAGEIAGKVKDKKIFDEMFSYAKLYNSASMMAAKHCMSVV